MLLLFNVWMYMAIEIIKLLGIVVASSGFWALCQKIFETLWTDKKKSPLEVIDKKIDSIHEEQKSFSYEIRKELEALKSALDSNSEVTMSHARERLNSLCTKYQTLGYIPEEEHVPFKLLGEAYIASNGNHGFDIKFNHIIENYPVIRQQDKNKQ